MISKRKKIIANSVVQVLSTYYKEKRIVTKVSYSSLILCMLIYNTLLTPYYGTALLNLNTRNFSNSLQEESLNTYWKEILRCQLVGDFYNHFL